MPERKLAIITKASSGIGRETAMLAAREGYDLIVAADARFFERAGMLDTKVGQANKDDPAAGAVTGWEAMKAGEHAVVHGPKSKGEALASGVLSEATTAQIHRKYAEPASGKTRA